MPHSDTVATDRPLPTLPRLTPPRQSSATSRMHTRVARALLTATPTQATQPTRQQMRRDPAARRNGRGRRRLRFCTSHLFPESGIMFPTHNDLERSTVGGTERSGPSTLQALPSLRSLVEIEVISPEEALLCVRLDRLLQQVLRYVIRQHWLRDRDHIEASCEEEIAEDESWHLQ